MITLSGERLSLLALGRIASGEPVRLDPAGRERIAAAHEAALAVSATRPVYGRTTGVGANKDTVVDASAAQAHGERLLRSHGTSAGPLRTPERVRLTMAIRLNQLAAGRSGARAEVADALEALLASAETPAVREHGSVGTGDLGPLATIALALPGVRLDASDALPFLSSNAATLADAALACLRLQELISAGVGVAAMTSAAVDGATEAYDEFALTATPFAGARWVAGRLRDLLGGAAARPPARLQDPFALRCLPQVHGLAVDELARLASTVEVGVATATENPLVDADAGTVAHHGGFHAAYLTAALDAALLAVAGAANASLRRTSLLLDPGATGAAAFLADGTPGASGAMLLEYVAASALGRLRALAFPASLQTVVLSRGVEDDASFATLAAGQALDAVDPLGVVLAAELTGAVRAVRLRGLDVPESGWGELVRRCAGLSGSAGPAGAEAEVADRDLTTDLDLAQSLLPRLVST